MPATASTAHAAIEETLLRNIAWQAALDFVGISPGIIDGKIGPNTQLATREFQRVRGLDVTGTLDSKTAERLGVDVDHAVGRYTIEAADLKEVGPAPTKWLERSRLDRLGHESLEWVVAEKFHCARHLLHTLNPGKDINAMKPGDRLIVPRVRVPDELPRGDVIEINLADKVIRVIDNDDRLVALFHCSVAASKSDLPKGKARVAVIVDNPEYTFNPKKWPEVEEPIDRVLQIPPGPRNPVGRVWIGLSLSGYGIHGTPNPELIGKTGSHGCIRLANWDAIRLSKMIRIGTPVRFTNRPGR